MNSPQPNSNGDKSLCCPKSSGQFIHLFLAAMPWGVPCPTASIDLYIRGTLIERIVKFAANCGSHHTVHCGANNNNFANKFNGDIWPIVNYQC